MKTLRELNEELRDKRAALDAKETELRTAGTALTDEQGSQLDSFLSEIDALKKQITRAEKLESEKQSRALAGGPVNAADFSAKDEKELRNFNLTKAIQKIVRGQKLDAVEQEVHNLADKEARAQGIELLGFGVPSFINEKRGQTVTGQTTAAGDQGGVSVETTLGGFVEALWPQTWLAQAGARRLAGLVGDTEILVQDTKPTIEELTEIEEMASSEILMSKFKMAPNRRGVAIPFSKQTLLQSSIDIQSLIVDNINEGLAQKLNAEAIVTLLAAITSGNGNLLGLGTNGAAPTYANMVDLEALVESFDAATNNMKYLTNSKVKGKLKKTEVFTGTSGVPVFFQNQINDLPAIVSNIIPSNLTKGTASAICSAIVVGNFNDLYTGMWGGADFTIDDKTRARKGEIDVIVNMFWDIKVARAKSFAGTKDALTA